MRPATGVDTCRERSTRNVLTAKLLWRRRADALVTNVACRGIAALCGNGTIFIRFLDQFIEIGLRFNINTSIGLVVINDRLGKSLESRN